MRARSTILLLLLGAPAPLAAQETAAANSGAPFAVFARGGGGPHFTKPHSRGIAVHFAGSAEVYDLLPIVNPFLGAGIATADGEALVLASGGLRVKGTLSNLDLFVELAVSYGFGSVFEPYADGIEKAGTTLFNAGPGVHGRFGRYRVGGSIQAVVAPDYDGQLREVAVLAGFEFGYVFRD